MNRFAMHHPDDFEERIEQMREMSGRPEHRRTVKRPVDPDYVQCPVLITGPAPTPEQIALGLRPNMPCGAKVPVINPAPVMEFRCPRGHSFFVASD